MSKANAGTSALELCHCGRPLHYADSVLAAFCRKLVADQGEFVPVTCDERTWLVQRHYIALHGLKAVELPTLGFLEVTGLPYWLSPDGNAITCGKCHRTSHNPNDVAQRYCGHCHEFRGDEQAASPSPQAFPPQTALMLYVIYRNPRDYPGKFVVREHAVTHDTGIVIVDPPLAVVGSLAAARNAVPAGLYNMGRMADDEPQIVEVWI